jgi:tetratricopeptide (TPR) repeat protein
MSIGTTLKQTAAVLKAKDSATVHRRPVVSQHRQGIEFHAAAHEAGIPASYAQRIAFGVAAASVLGVFYAMWSALRRHNTPAPSKTCSPRVWALAAVTGQRFDPLQLYNLPAKPALESKELAHGRATLAWLAAGLCLFDVPSAWAEGGGNPGENSNNWIMSAIIFGQAVGFVGALVTGTLARKRKEETEELARKLALVNKQMRQQSRENRDTRGTYESLSEVVSTGCENDECEQQRNSVIKALKEGKFLLRNKDGEGALEAFTRSLKILNEMKYDFNDKVQAERKAYRGLGAAQSLMGSNEDALQSMERVLELTEQLGDGAGLTDCYGIIADLCTELNLLSKAGEYYDLYLTQMDKDAELGAETML